MATIALDQTYTFKGKFYGPGPAVEVPDDFPLLQSQEEQDEKGEVDQPKPKGVRKTKATEHKGNA